MEQIGLISSSNGESFNNQLLNFSESYQIKKEKTREKVSEWRKKQIDIKNVTGYVPVSNPSKVKESKVKESKVNKDGEATSEFYPFSEFWNDYGKKTDLKKCQLKWNKISNSDRGKIKDYLPAYKKLTPEIKYRKNPATFLNNECWNDEIIFNSDSKDITKTDYKVSDLIFT